MDGGSGQKKPLGGMGARGKGELEGRGRKKEKRGGANACSTISPFPPIGKIAPYPPTCKRKLLEWKGALGGGVTFRAPHPPT